MVMFRNPPKTKRPDFQKMILTNPKISISENDTNENVGNFSLDDPLDASSEMIARMDFLQRICNIADQLGLNFSRNHMYRFDFNAAIQKLSKEYPEETIEQYQDRREKLTIELADVMMDRYLINMKFNGFSNANYREFIIDEKNPFKIYNTPYFTTIDHNQSHQGIGEEMFRELREKAMVNENKRIKEFVKEMIEMEQNADNNKNNKENEKTGKPENEYNSNSNEEGPK